MASSNQPKKKYFYSNDDLKAALSAIKAGKENAFACSKRTGIPYTTLRKKIKDNCTGKFNGLDE